MTDNEHYHDDDPVCQRCMRNEISNIDLRQQEIYLMLDAIVTELGLQGEVDRAAKADGFGTRWKDRGQSNDTKDRLGALRVESSHKH
jgi:hypothetical protein